MLGAVGGRSGGSARNRAPEGTAPAALPGGRHRCPPSPPRESGAAGMETYELEDALDHDEGQGLQGHHPGCRSRRRLPRRGSRSSPLREEDGGQDRAQGHAARCPR